MEWETTPTIQGSSAGPMDARENMTAPMLRAARLAVVVEPKKRLVEYLAGVGDEDGWAPVRLRVGAG